jgi:hypothetical protein
MWRNNPMDVKIKFKKFTCFYFYIKTRGITVYHNLVTVKLTDQPKCRTRHCFYLANNFYLIYFNNIYQLEFSSQRELSGLGINGEIITIIVNMIRHELGLERPVSTSSASVFKGIPIRLRPCDL